MWSADSKNGRIKGLILASAIIAVGFGISLAQNPPEKKAMNFIAVMDLKCAKSIDSDVCKSLTDTIISEIVKIGTYTVIDRANRDKILAEQGFQQTGCVDGSCTVEAGRLLGVGKLVVGSIGLIGQTYLINLQLINVQTASVENSADEECKCEIDGMITASRNAARKLMSVRPVEPQAAPSQSPAPPVAPPPPTPIGGMVMAAPPPIMPPEKFTEVPPVSDWIETSKLAKSKLFPTFDPQKAMVIFYQTSVPYGSNREVFEGSQLIGQLESGTYFYFETAPGKHNFSVPYLSRDVSTGDLELLAGQTLFVRWQNGSPLTYPPAKVALAHLKKCKYKAPKVSNDPR